MTFVSYDSYASPTIQPSPESLRIAANALFSDIFSNNPSSALLTHFSRSHPVTIQHAPAGDPYPQSSRLIGLNAVRSYFDLLSTHWHRAETKIHSIQITTPTSSSTGSSTTASSPSSSSTSCSNSPCVILTASVQWTWKCSGNSWREDFTCVLEYDDFVKVTSFVVRTDSLPETCVLRARDPVLEKPSVPVGRLMV
ncbi:hypothetical protein K435DRAFT_785397 [Dendrothele bispora CBS 962.96]|uniref:SnoaL-like domain-containing protein n=1 Tax=Dendrothele bispora (strain CBS 962.96) TaxID=1314807 RepID=A0A4S8KY81_DENBC|nr:hypothetical protein K435DRAFT_785397 [Dendrothele bispora CBS 962.96]